MTTLLAFIMSAPLQVAPAGPPLIAPEGPLQRTESVRHRFTVTVTVNYSPAGTPSAPWTMPLVVNGPWSAVDTSGFEVTLIAGTDQLTEKGTELFEGPDALGNWRHFRPYSSGSGVATASSRHRGCYKLVQRV